MIVKVFLPKYGIEKSEIEKISSIKIGLKSILVTFEDKILEAYFDHPLGFENPIMKTLSVKVLTPVDQKVKSEKVTKVKSKKVTDETWKGILKKCTTNEVPWKLGLRTLLEDNGFKIVAQRTNEFYYFFLINPETSKSQSAQIEINLGVIKQIFSGLSDNELAKNLITRTSMSLEHELLKNYVQIPEKVKKEKVAKNVETSTESSEVTSEPETESPSESQSEQVAEPAPEESTQESQPESEPAPESETQVVNDDEKSGTESESTEE
jgi:hypothetical protein